MICQALIRACASLMISIALAGCRATPELDHHAVSARLKSQLKARSRPFTPEEQSSGKILLEVAITSQGSVTWPLSWHDGLPMMAARIMCAPPAPGAMARCG